MVEVIDWNQGAESMFGYAADEAMGQPLEALLLPAERRAEDASILAQVQSGAVPAPFETTRMCSDGRLLDVSIAVSVLRNSRGKMVGVSKVMRDVSESKRAQPCSAISMSGWRAGAGAHADPSTKPCTISATSWTRCRP